MLFVRPCTFLCAELHWCTFPAVHDDCVVIFDNFAECNPLFPPSQRCYTKANGAFPGGTHLIVHRASPCPQDGLELLPLAHMSPPTSDPDGQLRVGEGHRESVGEPDEAQTALPSSLNSCCQPSKEGGGWKGNLGEMLFDLRPQMERPLVGDFC